MSEPAPGWDLLVGDRVSYKLVRWEPDLMRPVEVGEAFGEIVGFTAKRVKVRITLRAEPGVRTECNELRFVKPASLLRHYVGDEEGRR